MIEARLYEKLDNNAVRCDLCSFLCKIGDGKIGICGVRENREGILYTLVYNSAVSRNIDPIEKNPSSIFNRGSRSYSIATVGCNFRCLHCQNSEISQMPREEKKIMGEPVSPLQIVDEAVRRGCRNIAYTYTEPTIFFEYAYDSAKLAVERGIKNVFVTNGYMTGDALREIRPYLHAANVDLKSFNEKFYKRICGAKLAPVLDSIRLMKEMGIWVEVTTLIIPTKNDSEDELRDIARFVCGLGPEIPWHISAFYPTYKMSDLYRTPVSIIDRAREIGLEEGLRYVYTGNVPGDAGEKSYCYNCGEMIIDRYGFCVQNNLIKESRCPYCSAEIDGVEL